MNWKVKSLIALAIFACGAVLTQLPTNAQSLKSIFSSETVDNAAAIMENQGEITKSSDSPSAIFSYTGPAVAIPDNLPAGVDITLPVAGSGTITDLNFRFDTGGVCDATVGNTNAAVDHTFVGDLTFRLTSPTGQISTFMARRGGTRENICATIIDDEGAFPNVSTLTSVTGQFVGGSFSPELAAPLSVFDGFNANGNWTLNVSDNAGVDTGSMRRFSLDITSGPAVPSFSINDVAVTEGNSGTTNATFTVTLAPAAAVTTTITLATADQTAVAPGDYTSTAGTITFLAGETTKTLVVPVVGDTTFEPNETFAVNLTAPTGGAAISDAQGIGTINNDDASPLPLCNFNNGGLNPVTTAAVGTAAPAGFFWSELQNDTGNLTEANGSAGFSAQTGTFRLADNFTVPAGGCFINTVTFFAYQTGSPATPSPFATTTLQIWNGRPGDVGATVVFGDTTTNRLASSVDSTFFRLFNSAVPNTVNVPGTTRKIWRNTVNVGTALATPGTYWLDWSSAATNAAAHFYPAKTIPGSRGAVGDNARSFTVTGAIWADAADTGAPATAADIVQDLPFFLNTLVTNDAPVDFDGDGRTDFAVVRNIGASPSGATNQVRWFYNLNGSGSTIAKDWGIATDVFVPEDYDGDGKDDIAVWRTGAATTAAFYILQSQTNTLRVDRFGQTGDDSTVVGDYDGDNKADVAVYRVGATVGAQSTWFYRGSLSNPSGNVTFVPWGSNGDFPAPGDYDGDGKNDVNVQRTVGANAQYILRKSSDSSTTFTTFGLGTDFIVPGDYDGDGKTDIAVRRTISGVQNYFILQSSNAVVRNVQFGATGFNTVQGDYDGDGKTDIASWQPAGGIFWVLQSSNSAVTSFQLGTTGDFSVASYNTH
jgi:subtilisin-like proprotein convertase family protein